MKKMNLSFVLVGLAVGVYVLVEADVFSQNNERDLENEVSNSALTAKKNADTVRKERSVGNTGFGKQRKSDRSLSLSKIFRRSCETPTTSVPCVWSDWSDWSDCNAGCDTGLRERNRTCLCESGECEGESTEWEECPSDGCLPEAGNGCGTRVIERATQRIVGGETAAKGAWPWQAQLFSYGDWFTCGGTLVGPRHVISAAHCFYFDDPESWQVHLGKHNINISIGDGEIASAVDKIIVHEHYNYYTLENDIALMVLAEELTPSEKINFACLDWNNTKVFDSSSDCFITGWGATSMGGYLAEELQEANVPLIDRDECNQEAAYNGSVGDQMLCAGFQSGGVDSCQGDSGGPLVCSAADSNQDKERWYLVGITSWGYGCAMPNYPGVYTDVSKYIEWIQHHINCS